MADTDEKVNNVYRYLPYQRPLLHDLLLNTDPDGSVVERPQRVHVQKCTGVPGFDSRVITKTFKMVVDVRILTLLELYSVPTGW